ncbi:MAG TPA: AMP-binding protein [Acidimicrobiales bacterium]|nr:AMP-binding protein [Acidimicrobiales bacterium]
MSELIALDIDLGPDLEVALRHHVDSRRAICILDRRLSSRQRATQLAALGATHLDDGSGPVALDDGRPVDADVGVVMLTSGSSGRPKAAELTWDALEASAVMTQSALAHGAAPVWYPCLPATHIGGLAVLLRAILANGALVWGDAQYVSDGPRRGATHVAVVRAQLARYDLSGYETVLLGGARPPHALAANVVTTWGMTETGSGIVYDGYPLAGVEVASVGGELLVRTPTLFRSYRDAARPRATGPDGRDDWFPTGDGGEVDDGRVRVRGRLAYVINTGGEKVWPEDLETALASVPVVRDVAVTGLADDEWGERVVALVVTDGSHCDDELRDVAADRIGPWAKPKEIRYVAAIPRTPNGKIRRADLANLF